MNLENLTVNREISYIMTNSLEETVACSLSIDGDIEDNDMCIIKAHMLIPVYDDVSVTHTEFVNNLHDEAFRKKHVGSKFDILATRAFNSLDENISVDSICDDYAELKSMNDKSIVDLLEIYHNCMNETDELMSESTDYNAGESDGPVFESSIDLSNYKNIGYWFSNILSIVVNVPELHDIDTYEWVSVSNELSEFIHSIQKKYPSFRTVISVRGNGGFEYKYGKVKKII